MKLRSGLLSGDLLGDLVGDLFIERFGDRLGLVLADDLLEAIDRAREPSKFYIVASLYPLGPF
jgi:hypothetical protein